ncbi:MAG: GntR family transcriptional regulator [Streptosporangiales bacterium]|nr:GntR family transcriptional regulator [Streptosporangiales bacterium]
MSTADHVRYQPLERRSVPEIVAERLVAEIESGTLRPGDRLPSEPELARQFHVGRSSLREAIRKLHTLGVLEVVRGRGTYVRQRTDGEPDPQFVEWSVTEGPGAGEVLEVRLGLELTATGLACFRATQTDLDVLAARCREHEAVRRTRDIDELVRTDEQVHEAVVRAAHNQMLLQTYLALVPRMVDYRKHTLALERADERFDPHHSDLHAAIVHRNASAARQAVVRHISALYGEVRAAAEADPGEHEHLTMPDFAAIFGSFG